MPLASITCVPSPIICVTSLPTYAIRPPCIPTDIPSRISPEHTLTSFPPVITSVAGLSPRAVATSSGTQSAKGFLVKVVIVISPPLVSKCILDVVNSYILIEDFLTIGCVDIMAGKSDIVRKNGSVIPIDDSRFLISKDCPIAQDTSGLNSPSAALFQRLSYFCLMYVKCCLNTKPIRDSKPVTQQHCFQRSKQAQHIILTTAETHRTDAPNLPF